MLNSSKLSDSSVPNSVEQLLRELEQARTEGEQLRGILNEKNDQIYRDYLTIEGLRGKLDGLNDGTQIPREAGISDDKSQPASKKKGSSNNLLFRQSTTNCQTTSSSSAPATPSRSAD